MPYKKRGKRQQLLDLARKSRERAQAKRAAKTKAVSRANRLISGAPPKTAATKSPARKSQPPARKSQGRVIPKDVTRRTAKPSMVKPPTGKKAKRPTTSYTSSWQKLGEQRGKTREERRKQTIRASKRTGGGVPGGKKGFLGIKNLTADKYKQARLRAEGKRMASDLPMKIPGSMSVKTAEKIGKPLEITGDVLLLFSGIPGAANYIRKYGAKALVTKSGAIKDWVKDKLKAKKNPFKDLSGSKGRQGYKEPIGPSAPKSTPKAKGKQLDEHVKARRKAKAKATRAKNDPGKLADELKKATKPINKPYKTPTKHPLKSWKAPAKKKVEFKEPASPTHHTKQQVAAWKKKLKDAEKFKPIKKATKKVAKKKAAKKKK